MSIRKDMAHIIEEAWGAIAHNETTSAPSESDLIRQDLNNRLASLLQQNSRYEQFTSVDADSVMHEQYTHPEHPYACSVSLHLVKNYDPDTAQAEAVELVKTKFPAMQYELGKIDRVSIVKHEPERPDPAAAHIGAPLTDFVRVSLHFAPPEHIINRVQQHRS